MKKTISFFHFPRTGGSFVNNYLKEYLDGYFIHVGHPRYIDVAEQTKGIFKFSFVRNPFAWYVSRYFYYRRLDWKTEGGVLIKCDDGLSGKTFIEKFPTFEDHMVWGFKNIPNFSMQYCFDFMLKDLVSDEIKMQYIGKNETMSDDLKTVLELSNTPIPEVSLDSYYNMYKTNDIMTNRSFHNHYSTYYTDTAKTLVILHDSYILNKFNYSLEKQEI